MSDTNKTFGVAQFRFTPKTTRQKLAVIAGIMLLGYWLTDPGVDESVSILVSSDDQQGTLGEIEVILSEFDKSEATLGSPSEAEVGTASSQDSSFAVQGLMIPEAPVASANSGASAGSGAAPSLTIPAFEQAPRIPLLQNAAYTNQHVTSNNPPASFEANSGNANYPQSTTSSNPVQSSASIRLTGTIQPLN